MHARIRARTHTYTYTALQSTNRFAADLSAFVARLEHVVDTRQVLLLPCRSFTSDPTMNVLLEAMQQCSNAGVGMRSLDAAVKRKGFRCFLARMIDWWMD